MKKTGWKSLADFKPTIDSMNPLLDMLCARQEIWKL